MGAGQLRHRVTFQIENRTDDGGGGASIEWSTAATVWGSFAPERGNEKLEAGRLEASVAGLLKVRSSTETRAIEAGTHRVLIADQPYQIRSITNPDRRDRFLEMTVERGVGT